MRTRWQFVLKRFLRRSYAMSTRLIWREDLLHRACDFFMDRITRMYWHFSLRTFFIRAKPTKCLLGFPALPQYPDMSPHVGMQFFMWFQLRHDKLYIHILDINFLLFRHSLSTAPNHGSKCKRYSLTPTTLRRPGLCHNIRARRRTSHPPRAPVHHGRRP